jgi:hypothetical protein
MPSGDRPAAACRLGLEIAGFAGLLDQARHRVLAGLKPSATSTTSASHFSAALAARSRVLSSKSIIQPLFATMLFHSSIRKELARSFGATLVVLVTIVMTMTLIRTLGQASAAASTPPK